MRCALPPLTAHKIAINGNGAQDQPCPSVRETGSSRPPEPEPGIIQRGQYLFSPLPGNETLNNGKVNTRRKEALPARLYSGRDTRSSVPIRARSDLGCQATMASRAHLNAPGGRRSLTSTRRGAEGRLTPGHEHQAVSACKVPGRDIV
ncbi:hypothetical protein NDU88_008548 [Pleurodeles waltl]|uniref:Uncharacterized protein n=1 Tax=Pleurodeles waltl TaxID=8319 RepID=A0AAV7RYC6_PLEWA|nr:hypothetical protein NDU88_008548 [Pleurodeles waltl]